MNATRTLASALTLALTVATGCQLGELSRSRALRKDGLALLKGGQRQAARQKLDDGLALARQASARTWYDYRGEVARALLDAAAGDQAVGQLSRAAEKLDEALGFARLVGDEATQAYVLGRRGALRLQLGQLEAAAADYRDCAVLWRRTGDLAGLAEARSSGAVALGRLGQFDQALRQHQQALRVAQTSGDPVTEAQALNNAATLHAALGHSDEARRGYREALALSRRASDKLTEAFALNNLGLIELEQGHFGAALDLFREALALKKTAGDHGGQAASHANVSDLFLLLGQSEAAQDEAQSALEQARLSGDQRAVAQALLRTGELDQLADQLDRARGAYAEARRLFSAIRDRRGEVVAVIREALVLRQLGERAGAQARLQVAASAAEASRAPSLAVQAWINLCDLALGGSGASASTGSGAGAVPDLRDCDEAVARAARLADPTLRFQGQRYGALTRLRRGDEAGAVESLRQATRLLEQVRQRAGTDRFKEGLFSPRVAIFDLLVDLLARRHPREAFAEAERGRARGLLDLLVEARVDLTAGAPRQVVQREQRAVTALAQAQQRAAQATEDDARAAARALESALTELDGARAELRARSPRAARLASLEPARLDEVQAQLRSGELLLEYHLAEPRSYLFVVGPAYFAVHELPGKGSLAPTIELFQELASGIAADERSQVDLAQLGNRLYQQLVAPAGPPLAKARRLVIVPHGATAFLPFSALLTEPPPPAAQRTPVAALPYLVRRFEVAVVPSATVLLQLRRGPAEERQRVQQALQVGKDLLGIGNPVLGGITTGDARRRTRRVRAGRSGIVAWPPHEQLAALPFTGVELQQIAQLFPPARQDLLLASDATLTRTRALLARSHHRYVHFATHGIVDAQHPELSGLVLTPEGDDDGFLPLYEVYRLRLRAEMVVLSACQTALGKEVAGEGLIGLARGFLHAGAHAVVASLWSVPDESTSVLMNRLYTNLSTTPGGRGAALRRAQLAMLEGTAKGGARFAHPRHWAAFTLIGD
jgi:CHAT domain-containing protein